MGCIPFWKFISRPVTQNRFPQWFNSLVVNWLASPSPKSREAPVVWQRKQRAETLHRPIPTLTLHSWLSPGCHSGDTRASLSSLTSFLVGSRRQRSHPVLSQLLLLMVRVLPASLGLAFQVSQQDDGVVVVTLFYRCHLGASPSFHPV